jgi:predicted RNase H-like nuclease (RuvC/YqgF family)
MSDIDTPQVEEQVQPEQPTQQTEIRNPDAVLKALETERQQRKELEKQLKAFQGVDVEKYQQYTADEQKREQDRAEAEEEKLRKEGEFTTLTQRIKEEAQRSLSAKDEQIAELQRQLAAKDEEIGAGKKQLTEVGLHRKALKAFLDCGGEESDFDDFVWDKVKGSIKTTEEGGIQIVKGDSLWLDDKTKKELDLKGLFTNFREGRGAKFFKPSSQAEGSGFVAQKGKTATTTRTITAQQAGSRNFLVKNGISLEDISSGKVVVDFSA